MSKRSVHQVCVCVCNFSFSLDSKVPAFLNVVDIAGLVKGAHAGQGLGNAFLSHISACDGIFHMTREFNTHSQKHIHSNTHCNPGVHFALKLQAWEASILINGALNTYSMLARFRCA